MDINDCLLIGAFIAGVVFSAYILTHIKHVIKTDKWRASAISALCISAFLFFSLAHPKITKVVADLFGAKIEIAELQKKIDEKKTLIAELEKQTSTRKSELARLEKSLDETYVARVTKPLSQTLAQLQQSGQSVALFPNQVAVNPQLAAKQSGISTLPAKFKHLPSDAWVVMQGSNGLATNADEKSPSFAASTGISSDDQMKKASSKRATFIVAPNTGNISIDELNSSDKEFLKILIESRRVPHLPSGQK